MSMVQCIMLVQKGMERNIVWSAWCDRWIRWAQTGGKGEVDSEEWVPCCGRGCRERVRVAGRLWESENGEPRQILNRRSPKHRAVLQGQGWGGCMGGSQSTPDEATTPVVWRGMTQHHSLIAGSPALRQPLPTVVLSLEIYTSLSSRLASYVY